MNVYKRRRLGDPRQSSQVIQDWPLGAVTLAIVTVFFVAKTCGATTLQPDVPPAREGLGYHPDNGTTVATTPPWFSWVPAQGEVTYDVEIQEEGVTSSTRSWHGIKYALFTPELVLPPGKYRWHYRVRESLSSTGPWSRWRSFVVPPEASPFPRPSIDTVLQSLPTTHPRMLITSQDLQWVRALRKTHREWYDALTREASMLLNEPLMHEPKPWTGGKWNAAEWLTYYRQIVRAAHCTETLAFAYLVTGDRRYAERAREWLRVFASWDPSGTTSLRVNDEQAMHIMFSSARAYSWLYPLLEDGERKAVQTMLTARARDAYRHLHLSETPYEQFPYNSHNGRLWHFLGEVAIALAGDVPEAREWLDYAMTIYYGWYPIWGQLDGGWAEGLHYFLSYHEFVLPWLWQLEKVMKIPATQKPFYAQAGNFLLYTAPPGAAVSGFGDFSENPPSGKRAWVAAALAPFTGNHELQWYALQIGLSPHDLTPFRFLTATASRPSPAEPLLSPKLHVFPLTGLAAYNSNLADPKRNVQFELRASPMGNLSHSHCDQNAFVAGAFGDPLFVNTGYRDYYGSPFCMEWYWHTRSHNAVLIDGHGQKRDPAAKAAIIAHGESDNFAWLCADASPAYSDYARRVRRYAALLDQKHSVKVVILDDIETTAGALEILYHTRVPMTAKGTAKVFEFQTTHARVKAQMFSNADIRMEVSDHYTTVPVQTGERPSGPPKEWHLQVRVSREIPQTIITHYQVITLIDISPAEQSEASVAHARAFRWGTIPVLRWQEGKGKARRFFTLSFETTAPAVRLEVASQSSRLPDEPFQEALLWQQDEEKLTSLLSLDGILALPVNRQ